MTLEVKVYPYRKSVCMGNIMWPGAFPMRYGVFPAGHPIGGGSQLTQRHAGLQAFRERGYWASCFPEGDGITWQPLVEKTDEQCITDIRECFGWTATWGVQP
jgi:hypothetical protein